MRISDWSSDVCSSDLSVAGIVDYVRRLGALVGAAEAANAYADELQRGLDDLAAEAARLPRRPRVYFEEWAEPPITGIRRVAEPVRIPGGGDVFPATSLEPPATAPSTGHPAHGVRREHRQ